MSTWTVALVFLCASADTRETRFGEVSQPVEINFAPLPTGPFYHVVVEMDCEGLPAAERQHHHFCVKWGFDGDGPTKSRDSIAWYFEAQGWAVHRVGRCKLLVGHYKGRPVTSVKIRVEGIPGWMAPTAACHR